MSIFESGVSEGRKSTVGRSASGRVGQNSLQRPSAGSGQAALVRRLDAGRGAFGDTLVALARLVFPVLLLVTAGAAALIYGNQPARWLDYRDVGGQPFETGIVALPITLFLVQLTNRRYGAGYALVQVLGAAAAAIAIAIFAGDNVITMRGTALPASRLLIGFGSGLIAAQFVSIIVFDRLRGPRWWQAPLLASLLGGITLALVAYPTTYIGTDAHWLAPMLAYLLIATAASLALLVPYWLLRPIIAPLSGFGGY